MSNSIFSRDIPFNQFDGFYVNWSRYLIRHCLPLLRQAPSSDINAFVLRELHSYYRTLNHYASPNTILYLLFPSWRSNSLETPILFLGDIHPCLLTTLIRSFINRTQVLNCNHSDLSAWKVESASILFKIFDIELYINDTVHGLLVRMMEAQYLFLDQFSDNWVSLFHSQKGRHRRTVMGTADSVACEAMDKLVEIYVEANQLRRSVILDIVEALSHHQAALCLEGLCEFFVGFKHQGQAFQNSLALQSPNHNIYVGNLTQDVTSSLLQQKFRARYRSVVNAKIVTLIDSGRSQGYGFVSFADQREKMRAIQEMDGVIFSTKPMKVRSADRNTIY